MFDKNTCKLVVVRRSSTHIYLQLTELLDYRICNSDLWLGKHFILVRDNNMQFQSVLFENILQKKVMIDIKVDS